MRQDYAEITFVLDRSGSMESTKADAEGGFNQFIEDQRKVPGECRVTLAQFDTEHEIVYADRLIAEVPKLTLLPRGGTALLDAIGRTIIAIGDRLSKMDETKRPGKVFFVIVTDGGENSSREFTPAKIAEMIKHQRETYNWQFIFLGANQDAITIARNLNISNQAGSNVLHFAANSRGTSRSYDAVSRGVSGARMSAKVGQEQSYFSEADKSEQKSAGATSGK